MKIKHEYLIFIKILLSLLTVIFIGNFTFFLLTPISYKSTVDVYLGKFSNTIVGPNRNLLMSLKDLSYIQKHIPAEFTGENIDLMVSKIYDSKISISVISRNKEASELLAKEASQSIVSQTNISISNKIENEANNLKKIEAVIKIYDENLKKPNALNFSDQLWHYLEARRILLDKLDVDLTEFSYSTEVSTIKINFFNNYEVIRINFILFLLSFAISSVIILANKFLR